MVTRIGMFLRRIRIEKAEILRDMANKLGVSSAFLSAVENGKKKFPETWIPKFEEYYDLSSEQMEELRNAIMESSKIISLNIENVSPENRELAISFARHFDALDAETAKKLQNLLKKVKGNDT